MNNYSIKISSKNIFNYVVGNSSYDPIERCIDPTRFNVSGTNIYDNSSKQSYPQDERFYFFYSEVKKLRSMAKEMDIREIQSICDELEQIAPVKIYIG